MGDLIRNFPGWEYQSINQSFISHNNMRKKHREYNQHVKWQVQPGRNCAYSWPWNTNNSITIMQQWIIN